MAAVLRAPNQLCYYVFFFALFVTDFVHNVSANVSYGKEELLDIRTAITDLGLDKDFFLQQTRRTRHPLNTRQGQHPRYLQEEAAQVQRTKSRMPGLDPEKASEKLSKSLRKSLDFAHLK